MLNRCTVLAVALGGLLAVTAHAQNRELHPEERTYLRTAMADSRAQIEINELVSEKAADDLVRDFAESLLARYGATYERLAALARERGMEPVEALDAVAEHRLARLAELSGAAFDAEYLFGQIPHFYTEEAVHRREAEHGTDAAVREVATESIPAADANHERARELAEGREDDVAGPLHPEDGTFLVFAMNIDRSQVELGKVAREQAQDEAVRAFASRMVEEHGRSLDGHAKAAEERGLAVLEGPGAIADRTREWLASLPPAEFDRDYTRSQVIEHAHWYKRFEHNAVHGRDPRVRELAEKGIELGKAHHGAVLDLVQEDAAEGATR